MERCASALLVAALFWSASVAPYARPEDVMVVAVAGRLIMQVLRLRANHLSACDLEAGKGTANASIGWVSGARYRVLIITNVGTMSVRWIVVSLQPCQLLCKVMA